MGEKIHKYIEDNKDDNESQQAFSSYHIISKILSSLLDSKNSPEFQ